MSVLVSTYNNHSYLTRRHFNGRTMFSKDEDNDQVPCGVVNSMKQRLFEQVKHTNEKSIPKKSKCLSRSQENINPSTSVLRPKENLIIIDKTLVQKHRHSYNEFHVDEVPKPGMVSTVKNMFERQIRLSRCDDEKHSTTRSSRHSTRARSVSPNDMAFRQRRTVAVPTYPDVVISHRPNEDKVSSDIIEDQRPLDFRSRLALFDRTDTKDQSMKSTTFFAGMKVDENANVINVEEKIDTTPDVIGGNVKLSKSSISSTKQKQKRVQFIDDVHTYEYPSFNILMSEYPSSSSSSDSDEDKVIDDVDDDELEALAQYNSNENLLQSKGSLHTFRPSHLDQYELGSQHGLLMSDSYSRDKSENDTNHVHWSSMSTTTDLLF